MPQAFWGTIMPKAFDLTPDGIAVIEAGVLHFARHHARHDHGVLSCSRGRADRGFGNFLIPLQIGARDMRRFRF